MAAVEGRAGGHGRSSVGGAAVALAAVGTLAALVTGGGLVNYDTAYELVWGRDLAAGRAPDLEVVLAPTPHPLQHLWGLVTAPLPAGAALDATLVLAFALLGALAVVTYALGAAWFGPAAGVLAAAIVLTRRPVLDFGARAYVDVPYLVLVLGALLAETRRPRAGTSVVVLLGLAGLLRPEAWLFAGLYALWLRRPRLVVLAAAAPLAWALSDLALTGDPLHSLTGTRENTLTLERPTGLDDVVVTAPRRVGEILREPVLVAAVLGGWVAWRRRGERGVRLAVVAGAVAFGAFALLAAAGLPVLGRYLLLVAVLLSVVAAATITGPRWMAAAVLVLLAAFVPAQADRIAALRRALERQSALQADLRAVLAPVRRCPPLVVTTHRPRPLLALWFDVRPGDVVNAQDGVPARGTYVVPATPQVAEEYVFDPRDRRRVVPAPPAGARPVARSAAWLVSRRC